MVDTYILIFAIGYIAGVFSTLLFNKQGLNIEKTVSFLIVSSWLAMHVYGFLFDKEVPFLLDFTGFGAAGNLIGIKFADFTDYVVKIGKKR